MSPDDRVGSATEDGDKIQQIVEPQLDLNQPD